MENHLRFLVLVQDPEGSYCPLTLVAVNLRGLILHGVLLEMTRNVLLDYSIGARFPIASLGFINIEHRIYRGTVSSRRNENPESKQADVYLNCILSQRNNRAAAYR